MLRTKPRTSMMADTTSLEKDATVLIRCRDCPASYEAPRLDYICRECGGEAELAPQSMQRHELGAHT